MVRRALAVLVLASLLACGDDGGATTTTSVAGVGGPATTVDVDDREPDAVEPPEPAGVPVSALPAESSVRTALPGFGEVVIEVRRVDGEVVEWCLLLAETAEQRQRGLMEATDPGLGGYDGMLFRFEMPQTGGFHMRNTPQPLSIAYIDADGELVSTARMEPCADVDGCPDYPADGEFLSAIEVPVAAGGVDRLGIEDGAAVVDTGRRCSA